MDKSEEILKNVEARYIVENYKGQSKLAIYYHEEDVLKAIDQALTLGGVSNQRETLLSYEEWINEYKTSQEREKQVDKYLKK